MGRGTDLETEKREDKRETGDKKRKAVRGRKGEATTKDRLFPLLALCG